MVSTQTNKLKMSEEFMCVECEEMITEEHGQACTNCACYYCDKCYNLSAEHVEYHHPNCDPEGECDDRCDEDGVCGGCADDWLKNKQDEAREEDAESGKWDGGESDSDESGKWDE